MATLQPVATILFDLDDTLYRNEEIPELMTNNIARYMREKLRLPAHGLEARNRQFYVDYGTTLAGLRVQGYDIDYEDWHRHVHGSLPYSRLLHPDPKLRQMISSLPQTKFIFTNADIRHAETVLDILGIRDLFEGIVCFESIMKAADEKGINTNKKPVTCKPSPEAFMLALEQTGAQPETTLFLDDSLRNIAGASKVGLRTVLVGSKRSDSPALVAISSIHELPKALPELWSARATVHLEPHLSLAGPVSTEVEVVAQ